LGFLGTGTFCARRKKSPSLRPRLRAAAAREGQSNTRESKITSGLDAIFLDFASDKKEDATMTAEIRRDLDETRSTINDLRRSL